MKIEFTKYQGAGNDFIIIDCREKECKLSLNDIRFLCDRRFGVGADGLMTINNSLGFDFGMRYYNSDGKEASMCGNGGRCIAEYARRNKITDNNKITFSAVDGSHTATINGDQISLSMNDVEEITGYSDGFFLNTGSPHFVKFVDSIESIDVFKEGKDIADETRFSPLRTNVNFLELTDKVTKIATFERGVEAETLACGTGAVASAIVLFHTGKTIQLPIKLEAKGGNLEVDFTQSGKKYTNVFLTGPAEYVFKGEIEI
jgi:diaminopimelate epimerase